jgi:hypothetical protein
MATAITEYFMCRYHNSIETEYRKEIFKMGKPVLMTHHSNKIRICMLSCDSPKVKYAVYRQLEDSTTTTTFITRHVGIECPRAV